MRMVGNSLGGAIASLLGTRLKHLYSNLHVCGYGSLPCVDSAVAAARSNFVTSIIYNNELYARLSVPSILWLRASTFMSLSQDTRTDTRKFSRLARQLLSIGNSQGSRIHEESPRSALNARGRFSQNISMDSYDITEQGNAGQSDDSLLLGGRGTKKETVIDVDLRRLCRSRSLSWGTPPRIRSWNPRRAFLAPASHSARDPPEMFLPRSHNPHSAHEDVRVEFSHVGGLEIRHGGDVQKLLTSPAEKTSRSLTCLRLCSLTIFLGGT